MRLDLGSGHSRKPGYTRVDADESCLPDVVADVSNLPFNENSADEIYSSHLLEHFDPQETFPVLREWWRVLKPGGILVIKVPDCGWAFSAWSNREIRDCCLMRTIFGSDPTANGFMRHKNVFWSTKLERFLFITGFVDVENKTKHGSGELHYEARKP